MNYLEIELSGRTMMILGGLSTIAVILLSIWLAYRYNKSKQGK